MESKDLTWRPLGIACVALGLAAMYIASSYPYGTVTAMGPGFVPTAVAAILAALGALILVARGRDVADGDEAGSEAAADRSLLSRGFVRAVGSIGGAIILFGLAVRPLGLALTVFFCTMLAGLGHPGLRWRELILLAIGLAIASCVIFVLLLSQTIPMLPRIAW